MEEYNKYPNELLLSLIESKTEDKFTVLEVGCYCGNNLVYIKHNYPNSICYGLDIDKDAISVAKEYLNNVYLIDIEDKFLPFKEKYFDYIIFGDVLEHLKDPKSCLQYCKQFLKDDGKLLISIPNIQHIFILRELIHGRFIYEDDGILDKTHLKFFTYYEFLNLMNELNLKVENVFNRIVPIDEECKKLIDVLLQFNSLDVSKDMYESYQYIFKVKKLTN